MLNYEGLLQSSASSFFRISPSLYPVLVENVTDLMEVYPSSYKQMSSQGVLSKIIGQELDPELRANH